MSRNIAELPRVSRPPGKKASATSSPGHSFGRGPRAIERKLEPPLPLKWNTFYSALARLIYIVIQGGLMLVLAGIGDLGTLGRYALGAAITSPFLLFADLDLRSLYTTDSRNEYTFGDYLGLRLTTLVFALFFAVTVGYFSGLEGSVLLVVAAVGILKSIESVGDALHSCFQKRERYDQVVKSILVRSTSSLAVAAVVLATTSSLVLALLGAAFSHLVVLLCYDLPRGSQIVSLVPRFQPKVLRSLFLLAMPLGIVSFLGSFSINLPRYFLVAYQGEEQLGCFAVVAYFFQAITMLTVAIRHAASPRLSREFHSNRPLFLRSLLILMALVTGIGLLSTALAAWFGQAVLSFAFGPAFGMYGSPLAWLLLASILFSIRCLLRTGLTIMRVTHRQAMVSLASLAATFFLGLNLIPQYGLDGAAWSVLGTGVVGLVLTAGLFWREFTHSSRGTA